jgi:fructose 1,6-bisphosphatase
MKITLSVIVAGGMRGSHNMPLMPAPLNIGTSYFEVRRSSAAPRSPSTAAGSPWRRAAPCQRC